MTKTIKKGIILNGEIYEVIEKTTCTDCAFYHTDGENNSPCPSALCIAFAEKYLYPTCAFKKVNKECLTNKIN